MNDDDTANTAGTDRPQTDGSAASSESSPLGVKGTLIEVGNQLKPQSATENLKSNVPMPGDSLLTKVMKIVTSWT